MDLKEQLKELSFQMMLVEARKLDTENSRFFSLATGNQASPFSSKDGCHYGLIQEDKKGYELSLQYNELLLQNGMKHNSFNDGPDATKISTENLLYKYGLKYPISWFVKSEDHNGLHFGYYTSEIIDANHAQYINEVEQLLANEKIDVHTYERLTLAGEYFQQHRKLLSKYHNNEQLEETSSFNRR